MEHHKKPVALVTGAARRIGAAIACHLHQAGYRVVIHCHHSLSEANDLAQKMNQKRANSAFVVSADLRIKDECVNLIHRTLDWGLQLNALINNASVFEKNLSDPLNNAHWDQIFGLNVRAPFLLSHTAYPQLAKAQGSIINITDIHAQAPLKEYSVYCQAKAALRMQTKALAREFAPSVRVNAVAPGAIAWPEGENMLSSSVQQAILEKTPLKRHGNPLFIAQAVLSLIENPFITGQTLSVDGGRSLG